MTHSELVKRTDSLIEHIKRVLDPNEPVVNFWIDLFCGAGGTSTGIQFTDKNTIVICCVNHDEKAIKSHEANHPYTIHFREDIRDFEVVKQIKYVVSRLKEIWPESFVSIWASLECTNFSNAKGGQSRDADSRSLADHMPMYIDELNADYFWIENVKEFMAWGPMYIPIITVKPCAKSGSIGGETCTVKFKKDKKTKQWITEAHWKPISKDKGKDYLRWIDLIQSRGYNFDWRIFDSADFGAFQSRTRLFLQFAKPHLPMSWPQPTHSKKASNKTIDLFSGEESLQQWKAVREVLDLMNTGKSIFDRKIYFKNSAKAYKYLTSNKKQKGIYIAGTTAESDLCILRVLRKDSNNFKNALAEFQITCSDLVYFRDDELSENTLKRVYAGLVKFVAKHKNSKKDPFIIQRNSGDPASKLVDINGPARTVTSTGGNQDVVTIQYLNTYYGNGGSHSVDSPSPVVTTKDRLTQVTVQFIMNQFSGGGQHTDINEPASAVLIVPKQNLITTDPWLMTTNFSNVGRSLDEPSPPVLACRKQHYIINPSWGGHPSSTDEPCVTVIARQDKAPLYLISTEQGDRYLPIYDTDSEMTVLIKEFMVAFGINDIKMRSLEIPELLSIQGFPADYKLKGSKTDKKKFIGNAVEVTQAKALASEHYNALLRHIRKSKRQAEIIK